LGEIKKYLGVIYDWRKDEKGRKHVITIMRKKADEIVRYYEKVKGCEAKIAKIPGFQNTVLSKNEDENPTMLEEYYSLV